MTKKRERVRVRENVKDRSRIDHAVKTVEIFNLKQPEVTGKLKVYSRVEPTLITTVRSAHQKYELHGSRPRRHGAARRLCKVYAFVMESR